MTNCALKINFYSSFWPKVLSWVGQSQKLWVEQIWRQSEEGKILFYEPAALGFASLIPADHIHQLIQRWGTELTMKENLAGDKSETPP